MKISGNIITLNEEKNIAACIESMQTVCDEIIVVDSGSTDNTIEIAKSLGATVVKQPYLGDGIQKNVALNHTQNTWVLSLDADERLTPEMTQAIQQLDLESTSIEGYSFRRQNMIGNRWIKHCGWYPDRCIRLYNTDKTRFADVKQHASVQTKNVKNIDADIIHYSFKNIGELFAKPGRNFSGRAAKIMYAKGKRANCFSPFTHGLNAFIRKYIFQRGFMGGVDGMTVALSAAVNSYLKYAKLLEYQRDPSVTKQDDFKNIW
ncbi:glycosyltransferase family 2 protein [Marinomonas sp. UCMA 3892]|jgi:glycosyltransferase involved in cell wall biosynthesis|uniref:Glycosyltransferase involved in cell wall bisynthesis n=2 Tax=Marinomonas TaxID=28253 RepID=A0A1M5IJG6_9GAMM|nr:MULTISPECIES: glycosyltransferase family 2 protein [Marinomonas]MBU1294043.1 glycosyltransferase family 2 protein [Gammaproteobacteria bacterium]MBU1465001.1 glycosyltransferase family 2 protein [Gammaproteobacteria bacterium]MBU2020912.1 glycosyltransferase family 2 protein [Gammaproteobacteria bacterium]MBU2240167.1 glycosyltransferase family 2 protein [Gammaproteobacteria bacterium]MBU2317874.1 glycosyltransferase family 2 protein [Gammaproteobacteria bacterium]|tara:strand:+ start:1050 stop:1835 length:786 start_codon:yes stop_codon:yes gene_type:complete